MIHGADEKDKFVILPYFWLLEETLELAVQTEKIDGAIATIMALDSAIRLGIKIQKVFMIVEVFYLCRISFRKVPV